MRLTDMHQRSAQLGIVIVLLLMLVSPVFLFAQEPAPEIPLEKMSKEQLAAYIRNGDAAARQAAAQYIRDRMKTKAYLTTQTMRWAWIQPFVDVKMFDEARELSLAGTLSQPHRTEQVAYFTRMRLKTLLDQGKSAEALPLAKAYYNVCLLKQTEDAINLLAQTLAAAHPDDAGAPDRLRHQQTAAAQSSTGTIPPELGQSELKAIPADPAPYQARIEELKTKTDYNSLMGLGNLLLLADKTTEAREVFEKAYQIAPEKQLLEATENMARAIRAEDGNVGRANAWILSARQAPTSAPVHQSD